MAWARAEVLGSDRRRRVLRMVLGSGLGWGLGMAAWPGPVSAAGAAPTTAPTPTPTPTAPPAPAPFLFGTDTEDTSVYGLWMRRIYAEALRRLDRRLAVAVYPTKRLAQMAVEGSIDGEMVRGPAYGAEHPEMIRVDEPIFDVVFGVYALKPAAGMKRVEDLLAAGVSVLYRRGVVACEAALKPLLPADRLNEVTTTAQGLRMLASGRADYFCEIDSSIQNERRSAPRAEGTGVQKLFDVGVPVPLCPYLHRRHAALVPQLAAVLGLMKAEGLLAQYWLEAIRQVEQANEPVRGR
jgi:hypothetical protein